LYYPVIEWFRQFLDSVIEEDLYRFSTEKPLVLKVELDYFNSSSAKFLYDIIFELQRLKPSGIPFIVEWYYDEEDLDMHEAGQDISMLIETEFTYIIKPR